MIIERPYSQLAAWPLPWEPRIIAAGGLTVYGEIAPFQGLEIQHRRWLTTWLRSSALPTTLSIGIWKNPCGSAARITPCSWKGAERPDWNAAAADRYAQAAGLFQDWRQREVLRRDAQPTFYLMEHTYSFQGRDLSRTGLICCVGLEDYQTRGVLAHELTQEPAVQDRVALMDSCNANFSPIMSLYRDPSRSPFPALSSDYGRISTHLSGARRFGPRYGPMVCNRPGRSGRHHRQIRKHPGIPGRWTPPVRGRAAFERAAPVLQRCRSGPGPGFCDDDPV